MTFRGYTPTNIVCKTLSGPFGAAGHGPHRIPFPLSGRLRAGMARSEREVVMTTRREFIRWTAASGAGLVAGRGLWNGAARAATSRAPAVSARAAPVASSLTPYLDPMPVLVVSRPLPRGHRDKRGGRAGEPFIREEEPFQLLLRRLALEPARTQRPSQSSVRRGPARTASFCAVLPRIF
jgi:hypothetical protein